MKNHRRDFIKKSGMLGLTMTGGLPLPSFAAGSEENHLNREVDQSIITLPEMKKADQILQDIYQKAGELENYKASYYPVPHKFDRAMQKEAFAW